MSLVSLLVAAALAAATGETVALVGGMLHPVSGPDVAGGTIVLRDGKIAALGAGLEIPAGAKVVDVRGRHVYPSLFPVLTDLGLVEISSVRATVDTTELGEINPQARADFAMNFDSELLPVARSAGILIAGVTPGGGIVSGSLAVMKLDGWTREDATLKAPAAIVVRWPDLAIDRSPAARLSVRLQEKRRDEALEKLKNAFADARAYSKAKAAEGKAGIPRHDDDPKLEALLPALDGHLPIIVVAQRVAQIRAALAWAKEENVKLVLAGARDGWRVADEKNMRMGGYPAKVKSLVFLAKGNLMATSGANGVVVWPFAGSTGPMGKQAAEVGYEEKALATRVAGMPGGGWVAWGLDDGRVRACDLASQKVVELKAERGAPISALAMTSDARRVAWGDEDGQAGTVDLA